MANYGKRRSSLSSAKVRTAGILGHVGSKSQIESYTPWSYIQLIRIVLSFGTGLLVKGKKDARLVAFGKRVRALRVSRKISQESLAMLAGLDRSYMGHVERGETNLTLLKVHQIADALEVHPSSLFKVSTPK